MYKNSKNVKISRQFHESFLRGRSPGRSQSPLRHNSPGFSTPQCGKTFCSASPFPRQLADLPRIQLGSMWVPCHVRSSIQAHYAECIRCCNLDQAGVLWLHSHEVSSMRYMTVVPLMWIGCKGLWSIGSRWSNQSSLAVVTAVNRQLLNVEDIWDYMLNVFWCTWILVVSSREGTFTHFFFCIICRPIFSPMISALYSAFFSAEDYDSMITGMVVAAIWIARKNPVNPKVGEKGIALSGGQKARVCLARACYRPLGQKQHDLLGGIHTKSVQLNRREFRVWMNMTI